MIQYATTGSIHLKNGGTVLAVAKGLNINNWRRSLCLGERLKVEANA